MQNLRWHLSYWLTMILPIFLVLVLGLVCLAFWTAGFMIYRRTLYRVLVRLRLVEFKPFVR